MKSLILTIAFALAVFSLAYSQEYTIVFLNKNPDASELSKAEVDKIM